MNATTKLCRYCDSDILLVRRAVGDGYDAVNPDRLGTLRGVLPELRVVVDGFAWRVEDLIAATVELTGFDLDRVRTILAGDFDWHYKHHCGGTAVSA